MIGWELGDGRGHLEPLLPVVRSLVDQGCHIVLAMRNQGTARSVFRWLIDHKIAINDVHQAPIFVHKATPPPSPLLSLAEILAHAGFAKPALLGPVVRAWSRMLDDVKPDIVLAEFAPSLRIAAYGRTPTIMVGSGWTIPPDASPIAPLPILHDQPELAAEAEAAICDTIASISGISWQPERLATILRGDDTFVMCPTPLDPYRAYRGERIWCPPNTPMRQIGEKRSKLSIVAYLPKHHPAHSAFAAAVARLGVPTDAYFGGETFEGAGVDVATTPLNLPEILPKAFCVVHHGGLGMSTACLAIGVPQVILPTDFEKHLNAVGVANHKMGFVLPANASSDVLAEAMVRAKLLASNLPHWAGKPTETCEAIVGACRT
ncbi:MULTISPECIES: glycosyltransferase [Sphingomonas]